MNRPADKGLRVPGGWPALGLVLVLCLVLFVRYRPVAEQKPSLPAGRMILAVLPFENYGDDEGVYLASGLTDELIAQFRDLDPSSMAVIARTSAETLQKQSKPAVDIGRELKADYLLTGDLRTQNDRLSVSITLTEVNEDRRLWSERYTFDFADLASVQDQVAQRVARTLSLPFAAKDRAESRLEGLSDVEAKRALWRGWATRRESQPDAYKRAISFFEQAQELGSGSPLLQATLAETYNLFAFTSPRVQRPAFIYAKGSALKALSLKPTLAEAHAALAFTVLYDARDFETADHHFREAVRISPNFATAYHRYAGLLTASGRHNKAVEMLAKAQELNPASVNLYSDMGWYLMFANRLDESVAAFKNALRLDPGYAWAEAGLAEAYGLQENWTAAIHHTHRVMAASGYAEQELRGLSASDPQLGFANAWRIRLRKSAAEERAGIPPYPMERAMAHAALGENDIAFSWLEEAYEDPWMIFFRVDPRFDALRDDPRYAELATRLGL